MSGFLPRNDCDADDKNKKLSRKEIRDLLEHKGFRWDELPISLTPEEYGLQGRREHVVPHTNIFSKDFFKVHPIASKIVFLNKENLETLEGYKAAVEIHCGKFGRFEIHVIMTDYSAESARKLFDELKAMKPEEIKGVNE